MTTHRTLPADFIATLADRHMDQVVTGYAIALQRASEATSPRAISIWVNKAAAIRTHISDRGFTVSLYSLPGEDLVFVFNKLMGAVV